MTDSEMVIYLHEVAKKTADNKLRRIADRLDELKCSGAVIIDRSEEAREVFKKVGFHLEET